MRKSFEYYLRAANKGHIEAINQLNEFQKIAKEIFESAEKGWIEYTSKIPGITQKEARLGILEGKAAVREFIKKNKPLLKKMM